jgi:hypothetical protein
MMVGTRDSRKGSVTAVRAVQNCQGRKCVYGGRVSKQDVWVVVSPSGNEMGVNGGNSAVPRHQFANAKRAHAQDSFWYDGSWSNNSCTRYVYSSGDVSPTVAQDLHVGRTIEPTLDSCGRPSRRTTNYNNPSNSLTIYCQIKLTVE